MEEEGLMEEEQYIVKVRGHSNEVDHVPPEDMDVGNDFELDTGIDSDDLYNSLSDKHQEKTEDMLYSIYLSNPNHAHLVNSSWRKLPSGSVSHSTLWNKTRDCEEVVLFVGVCNFVYVQDGGNYNKVHWADNEASSYLSISIDESFFFEEYMTKIQEWERVWKKNSGNLEWKSAAGLAFKAPAFKKEEGESSKNGGTNKRKRCEDACKGTFLTSDQLSRCNHIQIVDENNAPIEGAKIDNGDLVVVKCHVRYWRNLRKNAHGINKHLVGVKLLKKLEVRVSHLSTWQKEIF